MSVSAAAPATAPEGPRQPAPEGNGLRLAVATLVGAVALVPRLLTAGAYQTTDETLWMRRTVAFGDALLRGDLAAASASTEDLATMPGVTTMWLGSAARASWELAGWLGLVDAEVPFVESPAGIHLAQASVAIATSVLIAAVVALAWRWTGPVPAVTAGLLLASEPFLVAHGAVLHTDELAALFGVSGALALLLALGVAPPGRHPHTLAGAAGVLLASAVLTKVSALVLAPGLAVVVLASVVPARPRTARRALRGLRAPEARTVAARLTTAAGAAAATSLVAWPALAVDTVHQLSLVVDSAGLAATPHLTFFLGDITETPGPLYYAVAVPLRMTPWFLLGCVVLIPLAAVRGRRAHLAVLAVIALPMVVVLSGAVKQFDRYALVVLPFLALMVGIGAEVLVGALRHVGWGRVVRPLATVAAVGMAVHAVVVAPWGLAYFNPLLGGSETAERAILVGWGEGLELAGERIAELEGPACDVDVVVNYTRLDSAFDCGRMTNQVAGAEYFLLYVNHRQRMTPEDLAALQARGRQLPPVRIRGIDYVQIYDLTAPPDPRTEAAP